jgi:hypothetical protein
VCHIESRRIKGKDRRVEYPHYDKMIQMLRFLSQAEKEVREQYQEVSYLYLSFFQNEGPAELQIAETRQSVADTLGFSGGEAISILSELSADDYIDLIYGSDRPSSNAGTVQVLLRQKGRAAIMEVPDPNAELMRRLEDIAAAIDDLEGVDPEEKERAQGAVRELQTFGRGLAPAATIEFLKLLLAYWGIGWR